MAAATPSLMRVVATSDFIEGGGAPPSDLLSTTERERAQRFRRDEDRRDFIGAHLLVRQVVAELAGVDVGEVSLRQTCAVCGALGHGRPRVTVPDGRAVFASWSHTAGLVGAVAAFDAVGLDLERVDVGPDVRDMSGFVLSRGEAALVEGSAAPSAAFLHWWTRKEALVKVGAIELDDFATTDLSAHPERWGEWTLSSWYDAAVDAVAATAMLASTS